MGVWGIDNYQPRWCHTSDELANLLVQTSLVGVQIRSIWSLWDREEDEWFSDAPVVIDTQAAQLEFCAQKSDEFSYSLDSIDLGVPVYWCCESADTDVHPFYWVQARNIEFNALVGAVITGIEIVEYGSTESELAGIALKFEDDRLEILNDLDCNLLARAQYFWKDSRYIPVESKV